MRLRYIIALSRALIAMACQSKTKEDKQILIIQCGTTQSTTHEVVPSEDRPTTEYEPGTRRMKRVVGSFSEIRNIETLNYVIDHYWDDFDYECGERVIAYDTVDICQALVDYSSILLATGDLSPMRNFIARAEASRPVLDFLMTISDMVLHDPNSPMHNDELYIPILEYLVECPLLDEYDRMIPEHDLYIARQNRLWHLSNDIAYTTADGKHHRLHDIPADYTLLMFNNPDCPMCREIIDEIIASPLLNEMQELGLLKVVAIYPDEDLEAWYRYLDKMPRRWIVGYDEGLKISEERSYDLRAIPSLYLLDRGKRVLVKDGVDVVYIEDVIAMAESQM